MAHIVIIGAGLGGLPAAFEIRKKLGSSHQMTVINEYDRFRFVPSNPWVITGYRNETQITTDLQKALARRKIDFIKMSCTEIKPDDKSILLADGRRIQYDYLVITTGPKLAFDEVKGLGPDGFSQSVCTIAHSLRAAQAYQDFLTNPGPIVIGASQGASCFGPAYETAMILDADLRKKSIRHKVPITFVTPEPYIGHLGLGGVGDSKGMLESELRKRDINFIVNCKLDELTGNEIHVSECGPDGKPIKQINLPAAYSMFIPAFKGVDAVLTAPTICNPRGFVTVDQYQRNTKYPSIFSAGVCVALAPKEPTPVPTGVPKSGYMIESMVSAVTNNIDADIHGKPATTTPTLAALCLADMGTTGMAFIAVPQIPPRNITWSKKGYWVHLSKVMFEKYFLGKMRNGSSEPFIEKWFLERLGVMRIQK